MDELEVPTPDRDADSDPFESEIRRLANRPPRLGPDRLAAALLPRLRPAAHPSLRAAAALLALGAALASWWSWPRGEATSTSPIGGIDQPTVLTIQLQDGTPLYLVLPTS